MAIKIDGKEMSKAWHYDMCIEMWNWIAEYGCDKNKTPHIIKHAPICDCFSCEIHRINCKKCPFSKYGTSRQNKRPCLSVHSPYFKWFPFDIDGQKNAIEIAQLFIDHYPEE